MNSKYWIPRTLDDPPLFFIWEFDIAALFIVCILLGLVADQFLLGVGSAVVLTKLYKKLKDEGGLGLLQRFMYWNTPSEYWLPKTTPSSVREFIGG